MHTLKGDNGLGGTPGAQGRPGKMVNKFNINKI